MSILYTIDQRKNPLDPNEKKYYLSSKTRGSISLEQLLDSVCTDSTIDPDEARLALRRTFRKTLEYLSLGFSVHFGDLGYFNVRISSEGSDTEQEVTPDKIRRKRIVFYPSSFMRNEIKTVPVKKFVAKKS